MTTELFFPPVHPRACATSLRLFRRHGLVIGLAGHLLPHASFPWRSVGALIHYDCLDPFLFFNADGGKIFWPSAEIRALVRRGQVQSFRSTSPDGTAGRIWRRGDIGGAL